MIAIYQLYNRNLIVIHLTHKKSKQKINKKNESYYEDNKTLFSSYIKLFLL